MLNEMRHFDAAVIGGGILGCFTARCLRRWNIATILLEKEDDVCRGITRTNSAIVYAGYDNKAGTLKAELTVRGNANMDALCAELEVPFSRCGSLLVTYDAASVPKLERKLQNGIRNGVPGLRLLSGAEAEAMEPMLRPGVAAALYAPTTGTVNPWQLGIAAYENALRNGAKAMLETEVLELRRAEDGYILETNKGTIHCRMVFNCAGLHADRVQELLFEPAVRLRLDGAEYLVLDRAAEKPSRVIFHQADRCGKGITAIPCVEGNLLISGTRKDLSRPWTTTAQGLEELYRDAAALLPNLKLDVIRSFGAVRPNPYLDSGESLHDFCIQRPGPGFWSLIGVKTPGLTCAGELGMLLAGEGAAYLRADPNPHFDPRRAAIPARGDSPDFYEIVCYCEQITRGQILEAIARGAKTVDAVKRRVGSGMGACQGSRCGWRIARILKEAGVNPDPQF